MSDVAGPSLDRRNRQHDRATKAHKMQSNAATPGSVTDGLQRKLHDRQRSSKLPSTNGLPSL
eukprot:14706151-Alexandrium_andersonii.AAC.1